MKSNFQKLFGRALVGITLCTTSQALGHEILIKTAGHESLQPQAADILNVQEVTARGTKVFVVTRRDGHLMGRPFMVEIRPACKAGLGWEEQAVVDVQSACDVATNSFALSDQQDALSIQVREADVPKMNRISMLMTTQNAAPICLKRGRIHKFPLRDLCAEPSE